MSRWSQITPLMRAEVLQCWRREERAGRETGPQSFSQNPLELSKYNIANLLCQSEEYPTLWTAFMTRIEENGGNQTTLFVRLVLTKFKLAVAGVISSVPLTDGL